MKIFKVLQLWLVCMMCVATTNGQYQGKVYLPYTDIPVFELATAKKLAWCGGMNNPQPSMADLNHDGKMDLVIYEQHYKVKTFINTGSNGNPNYVYDPYYEYTFPAQVIDYMKLVDYNRDGIMDLVHRGGSGYAVYRGFYNSHNDLDFTFYKDLYYQSQFSGWTNVYCEPTDIPAIVDVDNDGDLDFLSYYIGGGFIYYYRNCQVEDGLPADSIRICLKDICWGKSFQGIWRAQNLATGCNGTGITTCKGCEKDTANNKTTHTGNSLCMVDVDGDKDYDYFSGNVFYDDVQFLKNGRVESGSAIDTMIDQDSSWSSGGHKPILNLWPAIFALDIDQDGDLDLLFSPHSLGSENYKSITYFENTGSTTAPVYTYRTDTYLTDDMLDLGTGSYPVLYDYDKDGNTDLLTGSDGFFTGGNTLQPKLAYYRNIGTQQSPQYKLQTADLLAMSVLGAPGVAPAIGDINNDGKDDLIIGHTDGTMTLYVNTAASNAVQPVWTKQLDKIKDENNVVISVDNRAAPFVYDLDKDGKKDLLIGCIQGNIYYYRNTAIAGQVSLKLATNKLGNIKVDVDYPYGYSVPYIGKMDNTGIEYLMVGSGSGTLYRYDGFQGGNTTIAYTKLDSVYSDLHTDGRSAPAFIDFEGDNKYEMITGNVHGGLMLYRQLFNASTDGPLAAAPQVKIYPNPTSNVLYVKWQEGFGSGNMNINITSVLGQKLVSVNADAKDFHAEVNVSTLAPGVYYCIIHSGKDKTVNTITILR